MRRPCQQCGASVGGFKCDPDTSIESVRCERCGGHAVWQPRSRGERSGATPPPANGGGRPARVHQAARHEAIHIAAAVLQNVRVERSYLDANGGGTYLNPADLDRDPGANAVISVAPRALGMRASASDLAGIGPFGDIEPVARDLLYGQDALIDEIAQALEERGQLSGAEINLIAQGVARYG